MTYYVCSLPNPGVDGEPKELFTDDPTLVERFAKAEDRPGRGVYVCINPLKAGARRRCLETVAELRYIYFDLDLQHIDASREEVIRRLQQAPFTFTWAHDSGSGNLHIGVAIKDPPLPDTPEYERAVAVWKRLVEKLAADPAPAHPAALIRQLGTHNTKNGNSGLCQELWNTGAPCDVTELETFDELLIQPLLSRKRSHATGHAGHAGTFNFDADDPIDVEERLAAMAFHGAGPSAIHITQVQCTASRLRSGVPLDDVVTEVLEGTRRAVAADPQAANWDWNRERHDIEEMCYGFINKNPELASLLPDKLFAAWQDRLGAGETHPKIVYAPQFGWHARGEQKPASGKAKTADAKPATHTSHAEQKEWRKQERRRTSAIEAVPFIPFDPGQLPAREWLYDGHYQRGIVTATIGAGGGGKSSLGLIELLAMCTARNLLGEQPRERCRVWYHNAEEVLEEIYRRIAAVCQHYNIPQSELTGGWLFVTSGIEMPIKIAASRGGKLIIDAAATTAVSHTITVNEIDVACFDPLIAHHTAAENVTGDMDQICREFARVAYVTNCNIEIVHHTRKPAPGQEELSVADSRGAGAIKDAVRSMRVLNTMTKSEADKLGIDDVERRLYFRVDRGKANMLAPSAAKWRKIVSVVIANGDDMGVVTQWTYPTSTTADIPDAICSKLQAEVSKREYRAAIQSPDWIGNLVGRVFKLAVASTAGKAAVGRLLAALYDKGVITTADGITGRHRVTIVVAGAWRPPA